MPIFWAAFGARYFLVKTVTNKAQQKAIVSVLPCQLKSEAFPFLASIALQY